MNLGPPRDARLHLVAQHVLGDFLLEIVDKCGPFRPGADQAHLPF